MMSYYVIAILWLMGMVPVYFLISMVNLITTSEVERAKTRRLAFRYALIWPLVGIWFFVLTIFNMFKILVTGTGQ
jgi:hypothetical protein